ncbi:hypothetical protein CCP2SC5_300035 [Azospirillaceae bacterium]
MIPHDQEHSPWTRLVPSHTIT